MTSTVSLCRNTCAPSVVPASAILLIDKEIKSSRSRPVSCASGTSALNRKPTSGSSKLATPRSARPPARHRRCWYRGYVRDRCCAGSRPRSCRTAHQASRSADPQCSGPARSPCRRAAESVGVDLMEAHRPTAQKYSLVLRTGPICGASGVMPGAYTAIKRVTPNSASASNTTVARSSPVCGWRRGDSRSSHHKRRAV